MYYQVENKKAWLGPVRIFAVKGNSVFLFANGNMKKIPRCNVKLCGRKEVEFVEEEEKEEPKEINDSEVKDSFGDNIEEDDVEDIERMRTRSMERRRKELEKDSISTFWMKFENEECHDDIAVYAVEVPRVEHKKIEVIEAKEKELENMFNYEVFEEVEDEGQETIGSRWVITKKEKADGQKKVYKGRLVA